jgi:hypothetical protein
MNEKIKTGYFYTKDKDFTEKLHKDFKSEWIDDDILPIFKHFFSLPITPIESCYGHPEKNKSPYFCYIEDNVENEQDKEFQKLFMEKIIGLAERINKRIGNETIKLTIGNLSWYVEGKGNLKGHMINFNIIDQKKWQESGKEITNIIWEEFSRAINEIK